MVAWPIGSSLLTCLPVGRLGPFCMQFPDCSDQKLSLKIQRLFWTVGKRGMKLQIQMPTKVN